MRTIEINGKTVVLETGVPKPELKTGGGRPKSDLRLLLEAMHDGESAVLPLTGKELANANLTGLSKAIGAKFSYRTMPDGCVRIWRNARSPETTTQPARRSAWRLKAA